MEEWCGLWKNDVGFSRKRRRTSSCMQRQRIRRQLLPNQITRKSRTPSSTFGNYTGSRLNMHWHLYRLDGMVMGRIFLQERVGGYETLRIRVRRVQFESPRLQLNTTCVQTLHTAFIFTDSARRYIELKYPPNSSTSNINCMFLWL